MRVVFRVDAGPSDDIRDMLEKMELGEDIGCAVTWSSEGFIQFDFEVDADSLGIHTLTAARSAAADRLARGLAS